MTITRHTPGPWVIAGQSNGLSFVRANGRLVATVGTAYEDDPTKEANARLIAAAPNLLATLQAFFNVDEWDANFPEEFIVMVRSAIAGAEGGTW